MSSITGMKIYFPLIFLIMIQMCGYFLYDGFEIHETIPTKLLVVGCYLSLILSIIITLYVKGNNSFTVRKADVTRWVIIIAITFSTTTLVLVLLPTLKLISFINIIGYDSIRDTFFSNTDFQFGLFYHRYIALFVLSYYMPIAWFFIIWLAQYNDKTMNVFFWFNSIVLVVFSISIAGRFSIYYLIVVLYYRAILRGGKYKDLFYFFVGVVFFVAISFVVLKFRSITSPGMVDGYSFFDTHEINSVIEYNILSPFFLSQKITENFGYLSFLQIPFATTFSGLLFAFLGSNSPLIAVGEYFNTFTLYSTYTNNDYNAFSTVFAYFIMDFGFLAPFFCLFFFLLLFNIHSFFPVYYAGAFRLYIILQVFFSLYSSKITSPGFQIFVVGILIFGLLIKTCSTKKTSSNDFF